MTVKLWCGAIPVVTWLCCVFVCCKAVEFWFAFVNDERRRLMWDLVVSDRAV